MQLPWMADGGPALVSRWFSGYAAHDLDLVGVVAERGPGQIDNVWGRKAQTYRSSYFYSMWIFQRKETTR